MKKNILLTGIFLGLISLSLSSCIPGKKEDQFQTKPEGTKGKSGAADWQTYSNDKYKLSFDYSDLLN